MHWPRCARLRESQHPFDPVDGILTFLVGSMPRSTMPTLYTPEAVLGGAGCVVLRILLPPLKSLAAASRKCRFSLRLCSQNILSLSKQERRNPIMIVSPQCAIQSIALDRTFDRDDVHATGEAVPAAGLHAAMWSANCRPHRAVQPAFVGSCPEVRPC